MVAPHPWRNYGPKEKQPFTALPQKSFTRLLLCVTSVPLWLFLVTNIERRSTQRSTEVGRKEQYLDFRATQPFTGLLKGDCRAFANGPGLRINLAAIG